MSDLKPTWYSELLEIELQEHRELQRVIGLQVLAIEELLRGARDVLTGLARQEEAFTSRLEKVKEGEKVLAGLKNLGLVKEGDLP